MLVYYMERYDAFEIVGLQEQMKQLDALLASNREMETEVRSIIRDVLKEARNSLSKQAESGLRMQSDPRQAYRAIRNTVYRQILGGNVNILNKRKAGRMTESLPNSPRQGRGGNRRPRTQRTKNLQSYAGPDRGFILRFLNAGTSDRVIQFHSDPRREKVQRGTRGGNVSKYGQTINTGNRGRIGSRDWFGNASLQAMQKASDNLARRIDELIQQRLK